MQKLTCLESGCIILHCFEKSIQILQGVAHLVHLELGRCQLLQVAGLLVVEFCKLGGNEMSD